MRWLGFVVAWIIAPALVIALAWIIATVAGLVFPALLVVGAVALMICILRCIARRISYAGNPIHQTNRKYLKDRLRHIPY